MIRLKIMELKCLTRLLPVSFFSKLTIVANMLITRQFSNRGNFMFVGVVIYDKQNNVLIVKCNEESFVSVQKITVQGKRCMTALDFYNGFISGQYKRKIFFS